MVKTTLIAQKDTRRVPEAIVRAVEPPDFTETWRPYAHSQVLDAMEKACAEANLVPSQREYSLSTTGSRMFGVWQIMDLQNAEAGVCLALGIRNSLDKTMAVGLCAGEKVFVCDNLVFQSEFVVFRKHSGLLEVEEIRLLAKEALANVLDRFHELSMWHQGLHEARLNRQESALLTLAAMKTGIVPPSQYPQFYDLFIAQAAKYESTMFGFHGAVTEMVRETSLFNIHERNEMLEGFIKYSAPLLLDCPALSIDTVLEEARKKRMADAVVQREKYLKAAVNLRRRVQTAVRQAN